MMQTAVPLAQEQTRALALRKIPIEKLLARICQKHQTMNPLWNEKGRSRRNGLVLPYADVSLVTASIPQMRPPWVGCLTRAAYVRGACAHSGCNRLACMSPLDMYYWSRAVYLRPQPARAQY